MPGVMVTLIGVIRTATGANGTMETGTRSRSLMVMVPCATSSSAMREGKESKESRERGTQQAGNEPASLSQDQARWIPQHSVISNGIAQAAWKACNAHTIRAHTGAAVTLAPAAIAAGASQAAAAVVASGVAAADVDKP